MTESLFFSQITSKSIAAKQKTAIHAKSYQGDSSAFDKHLTLPDRGDARGRERDNVTELRKEPRFTQETRSRDFGSDERTEPKIRDSRKDRSERTDAKETPEQTRGERDTASTRAEKPEETAESQDTEQQTSQNAVSPEEANADDTQGETIDVDDGVLALLTDAEEDTTPDVLLNADASLSVSENTAADKKSGGGTETAQILPLFKEETQILEETAQDQTPEALATGQNTQIQTADTEEAALAAIKQPKQGQNAEAQIAAKTAADTQKTEPGKPLAHVKTDAGLPSGKAEVVEVQNANKNASFLGEVNIEQAQKADKSEIKARIGDLSPKTPNGAVATSVQVKTAQLAPQFTAAKTESAAQIQPLETTVTHTQNLHNINVRFGSLPQTTQSAQIPVTTIAFHIAKSVENGVNRFEIRIDPPELGRVDVKLEVNQAGRVIANLTVERPETLDLLQRDQRALERALQDAGLDVGGESLNFSLKDQSAESSDDGSYTADQIAAATDEEESLQPEVITGYISNSGVDIRI